VPIRNIIRDTGYSFHQGSNRHGLVRKICKMEEFFVSSIQHCFLFLPSVFTVSENAGIEPRTVAKCYNFLFELAEWLECLAVNAKVTTVLGSIPASSSPVESEGRQMKQC
jgi:hypothetical protein